MNIGDRVKPVETFYFGFFRGPESLEDRGTIVRFDDNEDPIVKWDSSGEEWDHVLENTTWNPENPGAHSCFGVVPA